MSLKEYETIVKKLRSTSTRDKQAILELKDQKGKVLNGLLSAAKNGEKRKQLKKDLDAINNS